MCINGQGLCYTINWESNLSHGVILWSYLCKSLKGYTSTCTHEYNGSLYIDAEWCGRYTDSRIYKTGNKGILCGNELGLGKQVEYILSFMICFTFIYMSKWKCVSIVCSEKG